MIRAEVENVVGEVNRQAVLRSYRAATELRNAALLVLRGRRSGRRYRVPFTGTGQQVSKSGKIKKRKPVYYTASAPGEAPANRTGNFRQSWIPFTTSERSNGSTKVMAEIRSNTRTKNGQLLGAILEEGTEDGRIKPRPFRQQIIDKARPAIKRHYMQPYIRR